MVHIGGGGGDDNNNDDDNDDDDDDEDDHHDNWCSVQLMKSSFHATYRYIYDFCGPLIYNPSPVTQHPLPRTGISVTHCIKRRLR